VAKDGELSLLDDLENPSRSASRT